MSHVDCCKVVDPDTQEAAAVACMHMHEGSCILVHKLTPSTEQAEHTTFTSAKHEAPVARSSSCRSPCAVQPGRSSVVLAHGQPVRHAELVVEAGIPARAGVDHHQVHVAAALGDAAQRLPDVSGSQA